jgi:hypothetical protein
VGPIAADPQTKAVGMNQAKAIQLFMTARDEESFSRSLVELDPSISFIDGQRWPGHQPPTVSSISEASQTEVFIWSRGAAPALPSTKLSEGHVQGPSTGWVVQFERSMLIGSELRSGRIAAGWDDSDPAMTAFVDLVWKAIRGETSADIESLTGKRFPYRIGNDARKWAETSSGNRLRDRSVLSAYFRIPCSAPQPRLRGL